MLKRRQFVQRAAANVVSLPAPVGGWNARDSLANMAPTDAVTLENYFPSVSNVNLRGGYERYATGLPDDVETLMTYSGATTDKLFAISDGEVYDVTAGGAVGAAGAEGRGPYRSGSFSIYCFCIPALGVAWASRIASAIRFRGSSSC